MVCHACVAFGQVALDVAITCAAYSSLVNQSFYRRMGALVECA